MSKNTVVNIVSLTYIDNIPFVIIEIINTGFTRQIVYNGGIQSLIHTVLRYQRTLQKFTGLICILFQQYFEEFYCCNSIPSGPMAVFYFNIQDRKSTRLNSSHANISYAV